MDPDRYEIAESSALFQGHVDQFFSQNRMSFQIVNIYEDNNEIQKFNPEKFRRVFVRLINQSLEERRTEGYQCELASNDNLKIIYPALLDDTRDGGMSGTYRLYPRTALCSSCRSYLDLSKNERCNCNAPLWQFTFVAFCDECGAQYPIHPMSNVLNDCPSCRSPGSLRKITWTRQDDLRSYRVSCIRCSKQYPLILYKCDHIDHQTGQILSTLPKSGFRGVPARSGAVYHPYVHTIPDIPQIDEIDESGNLNARGRQLTEAYEEFFGDLGEVDESCLFLPEFWECLVCRNKFWANRRVVSIAEDFELDVASRTGWSTLDQWRIIRTVLIEAKLRVAVNTDGTRNGEAIAARYDLDEVRSCLAAQVNAHFDESELQGLYLVSGNLGAECERRGEPLNPPQNWRELMDRLGIAQVSQISDLHMIQALLGIIEGSTRREVRLFRTVNTGAGDNERPTVFVRRFQTEGLLFRLDSRRVASWLAENGYMPHPENTDYSSGALRALIQNDESVRNEVLKLLHTLSHCLIQQSSIDTGLDPQSLSELIYPSLCSLLIYSTGGVNTGGLEDTFDNHMGEWLSRLEETARDCCQDPGCMEDEGGACNACLFLPEFVCRHFNQHLDRSSLVGGARHAFGYFR